MTTLGGTTVAAAIVIATAIAAWLMKPIIDKKREKSEEPEDLLFSPVPSSHAIMVSEDQPVEEQSSDIDSNEQVNEEEKVADLTLEEADAIQEKLMADVHSAPKKKHSHKKTTKRPQASDNQNKPKRGRPKKETKKEE